MESNSNSNSNNRDLLNGDHSFKKWFSIMWKNTYIQLFVVFFTLLVLQFINIDWCVSSWIDAKDEGVGALIMVSMGLLIPLAGSVIIFYKGFIQFWFDLINGRSR